MDTELNLTGLSYSELSKILNCLFLLLELAKTGEHKTAIQKHINAVEQKLEEVFV